MKIFIISYDLSKPGRDYDSLTNAIQQYGNWWHQSGSVWLIASNTLNSSSIRDYLRQFIDKNDKLFVAELSGNWAGIGFSNEEYDWMKSNNN